MGWSIVAFAAACAANIGWLAWKARSEAGNAAQQSASGQLRGQHGNESCVTNAQQALSTAKRREPGIALKVSSATPELVDALAERGLSFIPGTRVILSASDTIGTIRTFVEVSTRGAALSPDAIATYMALLHHRGSASAISRTETEAQADTIATGRSLCLDGRADAAVLAHDDDVPPLDVMVPIDTTNLRNGRPYIDTMAVLAAPGLVRVVLSRLCHEAIELRATVLVAFETRAMAFAAAAALQLGLPFVAARELEHAPAGLCVGQASVNDADSYRRNTRIAMDFSSFLPGDRAVLVDDVMSSGGTLAALCELIRHSDVGIEVPGCVVVYGLTDVRYLPVRAAAKGANPEQLADAAQGQSTEVAGANDLCLVRTSAAANLSSARPRRLSFDTLVKDCGSGEDLPSHERVAVKVIVPLHKRMQHLGFS